jgi:2-polyprenyl-3-methyl-5-hydroxy-6-metoxy-1,4-benzoquinol methylase
VQLDSDAVPYYREVIRAAGISDVIQDQKRVQFRNFISKYRLQGKRMIEFGCGRGEFLSILAGLEVDAYGLEGSLNAVEHCLQQGLQVSCGYPDRDLHLTCDKPYDAFMLLMFLEHMPNPGESLAAVCRHLSPDAVGLIEVPNLEMVLRQRLISEFTVDHLLYFTAESLQNMLERHGFEVLGSHFNRDDYVLSMEVRRRVPLRLSSLKDQQLHLISQIYQFIDCFGSVALWGAGHQALCMMSLAKLGSKVRYVVDSAPFKQGKFTPVTHIPIVSPTTLQTDPVDAVLIMAGSYSDEIATLLQRANTPLKARAILRDHGVEILGRQQESG